MGCVHIAAVVLSHLPEAVCREGSHIEKKYDPKMI